MRSFFRPVRISVLVVFMPAILSGQIRIGLYHDQLIHSFLFTARQGDYQVRLKDASWTIREGEIIYLSWDHQGIRLRGMSPGIRISGIVEFISSRTDAFFSVRPLNPMLDESVYDNNLYVIPGTGALQLVNVTEQEKYIASVVRSEGGYGAAEEFYRVQAVLARTFAVKFHDRHQEEGFSLCDGVHCQVCGGRVEENSVFMQAALSTKGKVIAGSDSLPVMALFHSSCGGVTRAADHAFITGAAYLARITDPYCLSGRNARWQVSIPLAVWQQYLRRYGITDERTVLPVFNGQRQKYLVLGDDSLLMDQIRTSFGLKSSFFGITVEGEEVVFRGRGNGHGVGLCQEGAMDMARQGHTWTDIINFYYRDVRVIDIKR